MKSGLAWILALSLGANGVLLAAHWRATVAAHTSSSADRAPSAALTETAAVASQGAEPSGVTNGAPSGATGGALWSTLDLGDLRAVLAQLRASGLPEEDVRTIVGALIRDRYKARFEALQHAEASEPFWKTRAPGANAQRFSESYALWRELEAVSTELLGPEPLDPIGARHLRQHYGPLAEEKLQAMNRLDRDYADLVMQARSFGPTMPWDRDGIAFVEAEKRRDIEALLSPEELEVYDLYASRAAHSLRSQLAGFEPTEAEFRALYALQLAFDSKNNSTQPGASATNSTVAGQTNPEMLEQVKAALGEERFREYERASDEGFRAALAVARRLNLPTENASAAYTLAQETRAGVKALNRDTELSPGERAVAMGRLIDEANARLDALLARSGAAVFRMRSSQWRYVESERRQKEREAR